MCKTNPSCCPLRPRTTPFPEENAILGVIYGVLLWLDMNAATPLGAWGRSVMSLACVPLFLSEENKKSHAEVMGHAEMIVILRGRPGLTHGALVQ